MLGMHHNSHKGQKGEQHSFDAGPGTYQYAGEYQQYQDPRTGQRQSWSAAAAVAPGEQQHQRQQQQQQQFWDSAAPADTEEDGQFEHESSGSAAGLDPSSSPNFESLNPLSRLRSAATPLSQGGRAPRPPSRVPETASPGRRSLFSVLGPGWRGLSSSRSHSHMLTPPGSVVQGSSC